MKFNLNFPKIPSGGYRITNGERPELPDFDSLFPDGITNPVVDVLKKHHAFQENQEQRNERSWWWNFGLSLFVACLVLSQVYFAFQAYKSDQLSFQLEEQLIQLEEETDEQIKSLQTQLDKRDSQISDLSTELKNLKSSLDKINGN